MHEGGDHGEHKDREHEEMKERIELHMIGESLGLFFGHGQKSPENFSPTNVYPKSLTVKSCCGSEVDFRCCANGVSSPCGTITA
jgi:hypothetical protein